MGLHATRDEWDDRYARQEVRLAWNQTHFLKREQIFQRMPQKLLRRVQYGSICQFVNMDKIQHQLIFQIPSTTRFVTEWSAGLYEPPSCPDRLDDYDEAWVAERSEISAGLAPIDTKLQPEKRKRSKFPKRKLALILQVDRISSFECSWKASGRGHLSPVFTSIEFEHGFDVQAVPWQSCQRHPKTEDCPKFVCDLIHDSSCQADQSILPLENAHMFAHSEDRCPQSERFGTKLVMGNQCLTHPRFHKRMGGLKTCRCRKCNWRYTLGNVH